MPKYCNKIRQWSVSIYVNCNSVDAADIPYVKYTYSVKINMLIEFSGTFSCLAVKEPIFQEAALATVAKRSLSISEGREIKVARDFPVSDNITHET